MPYAELFRRRSTLLFRVRGPATAHLLLLPLACVAGSVHSLGLGEISQQSALGQPLRIVVPIIASATDDISGECFRLAPGQRGADGVPEVMTARVGLERTPAGAQLVVSTLRTVNDPAIRLTLQAGCETPVRREYLLLMDPLSIDAPVVLAQAAERSQTAARTGVVSNVTTEGEPRVAAGAPSGAPAPRGSARRAPAAAAAGPTPQRATRAKTSPAPNVARSAPPRAIAQPKARLSVSAAAPATSLPGKSAGGTTARDDPANTLEEQAIVLRRRVAELSGMVDRMQQELGVVPAEQAARIAAENAAKAGTPATNAAMPATKAPPPDAKAAPQDTQATPQEMLGRWWDGSWPIVGALVGLAALIAAGLAWRRRRASADSDEWVAKATDPERIKAPPGAAKAAAPVAQSGSAAQPAAPSAQPGSQATTKLQATLDLELALDNQMRNAGRRPAPGRPQAKEGSTGD